MPLLPGTSIGSYDIIASIGAGGMGEVYRARDRKLDRDVAIKILPELFAADPERIARFEREAKTLASLNHPNIAHVHGLEEAVSGPAEAGHYVQRALVMELVLGPTLADRIAQGPVPLDEALPIARQIAEALEAAHEHGIIHRDLKPANIKVRDDGTVKVLDFGLAKMLDGPAKAGHVPGSPENRSVRLQADLSQSPTMISPAMTNVGVILGTAAYMAPEQAKGKPADKRSDIWAFGCVLYEMLTGKRPFGGDDVSDTFAAILRADPDWSAVPANTPSPIRKLLRRCLEKDRNRRLADIADARFEIDEASTGSEPITRQERRGLRLKERFVWTGLVILVAAVTTLITARLTRQPDSAPPKMLTDIATRGGALSVNDSVSFALSPDGQSLVFVVAGDGPTRLWLRPLSTGSAQPLAGTEGAAFPFWSPDSRSIAFFADDKLKRLDLASGQSQILASATSRGGSWNTGGVILFAPTAGSPLFRVSASGGQPMMVTRLDGQTSHRFPFFLPDGRHFLFYAIGTSDTGGIYLASLDSPTATRLTAADTAGVYLPTGWIAWVRAGTLVAQRLDVLRGKLVGDLQTAAQSVDFVGGTHVAALSISDTGLIAFRSAPATKRQLVWFDRNGKMLETFSGPDANSLQRPRIAPDGRRVVVERTVQGGIDLWVLDGTRTARFSFDPALDRNAVWSPDGRQVAFDSNRSGPRDLYVASVSNPADVRQIVASARDKWPTDWSADGRLILFESIDPQTNNDLWVLSILGDRKPRSLLKTPFYEAGGKFSPDGRWFTYWSRQSGRDEVYVRAFAAAETIEEEGASEQWQVSTEGGIHPLWRPDGKEIYYIAPDSRMMAVSISTKDRRPIFGTPVPLFQTHIWGGGADTSQGRQYDVARDGRLLINTVVDATASPITILQNWTPDRK